MLEFQYNTIAGEVNKESTASALDEQGKAESQYQDVRLTDGRADETQARTFDPIPLVYNERSREIIQRSLVGTSTTAGSTSEQCQERSRSSDLRQVLYGIYHS